MFHIAQKVGGDWKVLGVRLGMDLHVIDSIQLENSYNVLYATCVLLIRWRDRQKGSLDSKKKMLRKAVKDVGRVDLLDKI